jgi:hypothetical protein
MSVFAVKEGTRYSVVNCKVCPWAESVWVTSGFNVCSTGSRTCISFKISQLREYLLYIFDIFSLLYNMDNVTFTNRIRR